MKSINKMMIISLSTLGVGTVIVSASALALSINNTQSVDNLGSNNIIKLVNDEITNKTIVPVHHIMTRKEFSKINSSNLLTKYVRFTTILPNDVNNLTVIGFAPKFPTVLFKVQDESGNLSESISISWTIDPNEPIEPEIHEPNPPIPPKPDVDNKPVVPSPEPQPHPQPPVNPPSPPPVVPPPQPPTPPIPWPDIPEPPPPVDNPSLPQFDTANKMEFSVNVKRTSGARFNQIVQFEIVDANTNEKMFRRPIDDWDDDANDGCLKFSLPDDRRYKISVVDQKPEFDGYSSRFKSNKYEYESSMLFDKDNPNIEYVFTPIIQTTEKTGSYNTEDVSHEIPFNQDASGNSISLLKNKEAGKMSIFLYMNTANETSKRSLDILVRAISGELEQGQEPSLWDKVELYCFSDVDNNQALNDFKNKNYPDKPIHFIQDSQNKIRNAFFPVAEPTYPKVVYLDYEGVVLDRQDGGIRDTQGSLKKIRNNIKNYSKNSL